MWLYEPKFEGASEKLRYTLGFNAQRQFNQDRPYLSTTFLVIMSYAVRHIFKHVNLHLFSDSALKFHTCGS